MCLAVEPRQTTNLQATCADDRPSNMGEFTGGTSAIDGDMPLGQGPLGCSWPNCASKCWDEPSISPCDYWSLLVPRGPYPTNLCPPAHPSISSIIKHGRHGRANYLQWLRGVPDCGGISWEFYPAELHQVPARQGWSSKPNVLFQAVITNHSEKASSSKSVSTISIKHQYHPLSETIWSTIRNITANHHHPLSTVVGHGPLR